MGPVTAPDAARDAVVQVGLAAGLAAVGVAGAEPFATERATIEQRRADGLHGGMQFTFRNPARSTEPEQALPGARALVVGALPYGGAPPAPPSAPAVGRVARYATEDRYAELRRALGEVADHLRADGWRTRLLVDDNALVDRAAATRAGIGWWGRSTMVLVPGHGPWVLLGSVLTDAPLAPSPDAVPDGCGSCRRCLDGCPTGALVASGVLDARRCLAWLLQDTGAFPRHQRIALGDRLYGCDECQDVCPPGRRVSIGPLPSARRDAVGPWVDVVAMLDLDDDELLDRYGRWYVPRRQPRYLRRNALVVLGNVGDGTDPTVHRCLVDHLAHPDPLVRAHAVWAARRLGLDDVVADAVVDDPDPDVRAELAAPPPPPAPGRRRRADDAWAGPGR